MTGRVVAAAPHPFPKSTFSPPFSTVLVPSSHYFPLPLHWARSVASVCSPPMSPPGSEAPNVCRACRRILWYPIRSLRAGRTGKRNSKSSQVDGVHPATVDNLPPLVYAACSYQIYPSEIVQHVAGTTGPHVEVQSDIIR